MFVGFIRPNVHGLGVIVWVSLLSIHLLRVSKTSHV